MAISATRGLSRRVSTRPECGKYPLKCSLISAPATVTKVPRKAALLGRSGRFTKANFSAVRERNFPMCAVKRKQSRKSASQGSKRGRKEWGFLVIWQFQVREGMEARFEEIYGPRGDWIQLFARDGAYVTTELVHRSNSRSYLTLDFWTSETAYDAFRKQHRAEYRALDLKCEGMTERECEIGRFIRLSTE